MPGGETPALADHIINQTVNTSNLMETRDASQMAPRLLSPINSDKQIALRTGHNQRTFVPGIVIDKSDAHMVEDSSSGPIGEILSTFTGKLYRKPPSTVTSAKADAQKRVILDKLRD